MLKVKGECGGVNDDVAKGLPHHKFFTCKQTISLLQNTTTMANSLVESLEKLRLQSKSSNAASQEDWIDQHLEDRRPRKRTKRDPDALKLELEKRYLTPPTKFSPEWLNRLQQYYLSLSKISCRS